MIPHKNSYIPENQISPFNIHGLNGRILHIPHPRKKREILFIYGHHASLERIYGIIDDLSQYGTITAPDLPGFGGMESLYKIDEEPSIDTLADYMAAVIKLRYKKRQFTVVAFSIGFAIITRMLQKYPELTKQVDILISVVGFTNKADFKIPKNAQRFYKYISVFFSGKYTSKIFRYVALNGLVLRTLYRYMPNARHKFAEMDKDEFKRMINFEVELWHNNDVRTYARTTTSMFTLDLSHWKIDLPVRHISVGEADQYFDNTEVARNMKRIYKSYKVSRALVKQHATSVVANKEESRPLVPDDIRRLLNTSPKKRSK